jgi:tetratricopeptide (TPR) repeat protein
MRYRLLETVSEYAAERLAESGDRTGSERRHLVHFRELARTGHPLLHSPEQLHWVARFQNEYENLRAALRRAVAAKDEHEALCLVHSLAWYWQVRDQRNEVRHWTAAILELSEDPFLVDPVERAPAVFEGCTDAPPPMRPEVLQEARRGIRILHVVTMDHNVDAWYTPEAKDWLRRVVATYSPELPQACRAPGSFWIMALLMTGEDDDELREVINRTVDACRGFGYEWELACALEMRAKIFANRTAWAGDARRDGEESLEIFRRIGDAWGAAEALSSLGEAHERFGDFARAVDAYEEALTHAEALDANPHALLLRTRLAGALIEAGRGDEGEALLRAGMADPGYRGSESGPPTRLFLGIRLARTGRLTEAREQFTLLREDFDNGNLRIFDGVSLGLLAWVANLEGSYEEGLSLGVRALDRVDDTLSRMVAPQMVAVHLMIVAGSLAGLATAGTGADESLAADAARLLGTYQKHLPAGYFANGQEVESRDFAAGLARETLGDAAYESACAEGGDLSVEEATALVFARRDEYRNEQDAGD